MSQSVTVEILVDPFLASQESIAEILLKLKDYGAILKTIGGILEEGLLEWFETRGEGTWAALSPVTRRDKAARGFGDMPDLVRTGALKAALTQDGAFGHKFLVSQDSVTVGVLGDMIPYANWLATGTRNMPARILVNIPADTMNKVLQAITDWLGGGDAVRVYAA
jgi:hypothetical protein